MWLLQLILQDSLEEHRHMSEEYHKRYNVEGTYCATDLHTSSYKIGGGLLKCDGATRTTYGVRTLVGVNFRSFIMCIYPVNFKQLCVYEW